MKDVCPLLTIAKAKLYQCIGKDCAWYRNEKVGCVIQLIRE
jgi:hypothetical protein